MARSVRIETVLIVLLVAMTGCARFEPQPIVPARTAAQLAARSLNDPSLRAFVETNLSDNEGEGLPSSWDLTMLTLAAIYLHPELDVARAQWAVAEAGRISAGERPDIGVGLATGKNTTTAIPSSSIVTASGDLTLETAGKRSYRIEQSAQLSEAARLNIASVVWQLRSSVRSNLVALFAALESQTLLRRQQNILQDNVRILEAQHDAGAISTFELTQARLGIDNARLDLRDAERRAAEARIQLAGAVGVPASALDDIEISFTNMIESPAIIATAEVRRTALASRADILVALAEYAASQSNLQLEIARQYPDIQLGPGYEYDQGDNKWSLGIALTLPANRNRGPIAEAQARREEAAAQFNALQAGVLQEIELAAAALRLALQKEADANTMLEELTRQESVALAMLEIGQISRSELAALQIQLSASALNRLDALVQTQQAVGQLEDAIQLPLDLPPAIWENAPRSPGPSANRDNS